MGKQSKVINNKATDAFFTLVRAGLWESEGQLSQFASIDNSIIWRMADEQAVVGLVAAGIEHVHDIKIPQNIALQFVGSTLQLEQRNKVMNQFVEKLIAQLRQIDVYALLIKGQGVAQCYRRPLWRSCGDVDLLLNEYNYNKAKAYLLPLASEVEPEGEYKKHLGLTIGSWVVELHGNLRCGLSTKMDKILDEVQNIVFCEGKVRSWMDGGTQIPLPDINSDILFIFTHFIKHFYCEGLGLRQICDWCRLLWRNKKSVDRELIEIWIRKMGMMSEWKAFAAFAVVYLGMPSEAMPLYEDTPSLRKKAERIKNFILEVGNFGHNRDMSYLDKYPYLIRKFISMRRRCGVLFRHAWIFPLDSLIFFPRIMYHGFRSAANGE